MAEALASTHHVVAVARTVGALEELDDRIQAAGGSATLAPMDITNADAMATLCRGIHDRWGKLDLWVHAAIHAAPLSPADHIDAKDWKKSVEVNTNAVSVLIPYIAPLLGTDGTAVFFDDSQSRGGQFYGPYGATKAAQISLAQSWAVEAARTGPKVHILEPQPMPTATRARFFPGEDRSTLTPADQEARRLLSLL